MAGRLLELAEDLRAAVAQIEENLGDLQAAPGVSGPDAAPGSERGWAAQATLRTSLQQPLPRWLGSQGHALYHRCS